MQHDVYINPALRTRRAFPFVAVLQADIANEGRSRMVALMIPRGALTNAPGRLLPVFGWATGSFIWHSKP